MLWLLLWLLVSSSLCGVIGIGVVSVSAIVSASGVVIVSVNVIR